MSLNGGVNAWLEGKFGWRYRSAGFILVIGMVLLVVVVVVSIWYRYCGSRRTKKRNHASLGNRVMVAVTKGAAGKEGGRLARRHLAGLKDTLEKELGRAVVLEAVLLWMSNSKHNENDDDDAPLAVSELCAQCGIPVHLLKGAGMSTPPGAWASVRDTVDAKQSAQRVVDAVLCAEGEHVAFLAKRHTVWRL